MTTMTKTRTGGKAKSKPVKKRWVNWQTAPRGTSHFGVLRITEQTGNGKKVDFLYFVRALPSDLGIGVEFAELDGSGDEYQVSVDPEAPPDSGADHCCCLGFERWGHCKHISATRALMARGRLGW